MSSGSDRASLDGSGHTTEEEDEVLFALLESLELNIAQRVAAKIPQQSGIEWVMQTMSDATQCRAMFRLAADQIHALHWLLTTRYGLEGTYEVSTMEALGIFLFIMAGSQRNGVANNRLVSLGSTISRYFHRILNLVAMLAADIVKPADPNFEMVHHLIMDDPRYHPFYSSVGAVNGTHVPMVVHSDTANEHRNMHHYTSRNVLVVVGWDMRVLFVDSGWPRSVHD